MAEAIVLIDEANRDRFEFPINPETISIGDGRDYQDVPLIGAPTATVAGSQRLIEVSWEGFFPRFYDRTLCNYFPIERPRNSVRRIKRWFGSGVVGLRHPTVLRTVITGTGFSLLMVVTEFSTEHRGGEPGDIYYSIALRQFRRQYIRIERPQTGGVNLNDPEIYTSGSGTKRETPEPSLGSQTYTVKAGDTLWLIAEKFYKNGSQWPKIYEANRKVIGSNPNLIKVGQTLVIP